MSYDQLQWRHWGLSSARKYYSIGQLAHECGQSQYVINRVLAEHNVPPAVAIRRTLGFDPDVLIWLKKEFARQEAEDARREKYLQELRDAINGIQQDNKVNP